MDALQIEAAAEGRAERRQRQQRDGQRIGADMLQQLLARPASPAKSRAAPAPSGSGSAASRAAVPAIAAMPTAIMAPEISPPGRCAHKNSAPPAAPIASVSSTLRVLVRLGNGRCHRCGDAGSRRLMSNPRAAGQMRQRDCSNAGFMPTGDAPSRRQAGVMDRRCSSGLDAAALEPALAYHRIPAGEASAVRTNHCLAAAVLCVFLHSERNFLRSLPWSPLASASLEHSSEAAL